MNEPLAPPTIVEPKKKTDRRRIWAGFFTGILLVALPFVIATQVKNQDVGVLILAALFSIGVVPLLAIVLAIIRPTRKFGLGLLLACGLGGLVLGAICGGVFR